VPEAPAPGAAAKPTPLHLQVAPLGLSTGQPTLFLDDGSAAALGVAASDRVRLRRQGAAAWVAAAVAIGHADGPGGLSVELQDKLQAKEGEACLVEAMPRPASLPFIRAKLDGRRLAPAEVEQVMRDLSNGALTTSETALWAAGVHVHGMDLEETVACIRGMVDGGERIRFGPGPVLDVHSIGGVPGNTYAPLTVAIVAAHGLRIPKTSSRAVSSACGTADFMEVLAPVVLSPAQLKAVTERTGGALAWGGGLRLAPADDEIIRVEQPLGIDPVGQLVASVLAKKVAVGATHVLIDLPCGPGAKVRDRPAAEALGAFFRDAAARLGLELECIITVGDRPVGRAIGPVLEAREALHCLEAGDGPAPLVDKACRFAGRLLELGGKAAPGEGMELARATLRDGRAHRKFLAIVAAQGGDPGIRSDTLEPGPHWADAVAPPGGLDLVLPNRALVEIARAAGAPRRRGAGIRFLAEPGSAVAAGEPAFRVHAEHPFHLQQALLAVAAQTRFVVRPP
jgi:AMP phosphorylase